jgi:hypothetical protein
MGGTMSQLTTTFERRLRLPAGIGLKNTPFKLATEPIRHGPQALSASWRRRLPRGKHHPST